MKRLLTTFALLLAILCMSAPARSQSSNFNAVSQILQPAALTATTINLGDQTNGSWKGLHLIINCSAFTSGTYTVHIQGKDPISGLYYDILVGTAISGTGVTVLKVYPGIAASANASASDLLPQTWRVQLIGATSPSMTLSISAYLEY